MDQLLVIMIHPSRRGLDVWVRRTLLLLTIVDLLLRLIGH